MSAQGPQRSDAGEARTCDPWVSSQAIYMVRTALKRPGISEVGPKRPYIQFEALKRL